MSLEAFVQAQEEALNRELEEIFEEIFGAPEMTEGDTSQPPSPEEMNPARNLNQELQGEEMNIVEENEIEEVPILDEESSNNEDEPQQVPVLTQAQLLQQVQQLQRQLQQLQQAAAPPPAAHTPVQNPPQTPGIALTPSQFQTFMAQQQQALLALQLQTQQQQPIQPRKKQLVAPRVGGVVANKGVWTGNGVNDRMERPASINAWRDFADDNLKSLKAIGDIEEACRKGLKATSTLLFCFDTETNAGEAPTVLKNLEFLCKSCGLEGVFQIVRPNGDIIDMFKSPGLVTRKIVRDWLEDLLFKGVHIGNGNRHPVCPHDKVNSEIASHIVLNSCSDLLRQDTLDECEPVLLQGPYILFETLLKVHRPDVSKLNSYRDELMAVRVVNIEGQNFTTLKLLCAPILRKMELHYTYEDPIIDLSMLVIKTGLSCTDIGMQQWLKDKIVDLNGDPALARSTKHAHRLLLQMEDRYISLKDANAYDPAKKPSPDEVRHKAMQAQVNNLEKKYTQLHQDRTANSTKGNSGDTPNSSADASSSDRSKKDKARRYKGPEYYNLTEYQFWSTIEQAKSRKQNMDPSKIGEDEEHSIEVDGEITAKWCNHCGGFAKGKFQHYTSGHDSFRAEQQKNRTQAKPTKPAGMQAAAPATAPAAAAAPAASPKLVSFGPPVTYDFNAMQPPSQPASKLAAFHGSTDLCQLTAPHESTDPASDDEPAPEAPSFLDILNRKNPHLKGGGR